MLHILLLILKVIGIILLVVLLLCLTLFLLVLLVPVRFKGQGSYYEKPEGSFKVTWLLRLISVAVSYKEELDVTVRFFGIRIFKECREETAEELLGEAAEDVTKETKRDLEELTRAGQTVAERNEEKSVEPLLSIQELKEPLTDPKIAEGEKSEKTELIPETPVQETRKEPAKKKLFNRLWEKIKNIFFHIKLLFKRVLVSLKRAEEYRQSALAFLQDEENKKTFHLILRQAKKIALHVLPKKLKGRITFGVEDPYLMGQILSGAAMFYPFYQRQFLVTPIFDKKLLEGEIAFRGRIRLGVFFAAGLKILLNKNFRKQLRKFMNRGGM